MEALLKTIARLLKLALLVLWLIENALRAI